MRAVEWDLKAGSLQRANTYQMGQASGQGLREACCRLFCEESMDSGQQRIQGKCKKNAQSLNLVARKGTPQGAGQQPNFLGEKVLGWVWFAWSL